MARGQVSYFGFNRGLVSVLGLARADIKRMAMSAESMTNWIPRVLGSMSLRPGLRYIGTTLTNQQARLLPFIFSSTDKARIELTNLVMRVWISDTVITRPSVSSAVTNGAFAQYSNTVTMTSANPGVFTYTGADNFAESDPITFTTTGALPTNVVVGTTYYVKVGTLNVGANTFQIAATPTGTAIDTTAGVQSGVHTVYAYYFITGWTDSDESGGVSKWTNGDLELLGTGTAAAIRDQTITVAGGDQNVEHALNINIVRGPVTLRVGSTSGGDEYINQTELDTGYHSLSLTPTGNFYIRFQSRLSRIVYVGSCEIASAGAMSLTTPWSTSALDNIKYDQSGDIIFVAGGSSLQQYKIERRATRSWSVVKYETEDGPFQTMNVGPITITPSVLTGNGTLTASKALFRSGDVGELIALTSTGQSATKSMTVLNDATNSILVEGVSATRSFSVVITGLTGTGNTVTLQQSFDGTTWATSGGSAILTSGGSSVTADLVVNVNDGLDNQTVYYRLKCTTYASGTTVSTITITTGSVRGICRVTAYTSNTVVSMEVLSDLGGTTAVTDWEEGLWSDYRGWPSAVAFHEGRLWWFGKDRVVGSVSDGYYSFDHTVTGDSAPINRTIGKGPINTINWALSLQRLVIGGQSAELTCRSTSLDEPITPTNFNLKEASSQGSQSPQAVAVDAKGVYVQRGGTRVFELDWADNGIDYTSKHLSALIPEIGQPRIIRLSVQRQPDTRIHCLRSDGTVALLVYDKVENVICWCEVETTGATGLVEDIMILPGDSGDEEDHVFYVVNRTIGGATKRYIEQWAFESDCINGALNLVADSYITYTGAATTNITGLSHLEGQVVDVWANGSDVGHDENDARLYTVSGGAITLATAATNVVVGLPYQARWKSGKLVQLQNQLGTALKSTKEIQGLGVVLVNTHHKGLKFGSDFTTMDNLPSVEYGAAVADGTVYAAYDEPAFIFPGTWETDARLCLEANSPRAVTVAAAICDVEHHS